MDRIPIKSTRQTRPLDERLQEQQTRLALEKISLERKVIKTRAKMLSTYAAAEKGRLTHDWRAPKKSADQEIIADSEVLNARARQMRRDKWDASSAVMSYCRNTVGTGITARSNARDPETGEPFDDFNKKIDRLWKQWSERKGLCDIEQSKTFIEMQRLAVAEYVVVGESFAIRSFLPRADRVGLVIQMAEPEQLDMVRTKNLDTGNEIRGGIEINSYGAALTYWFYSGSNSNNGYSQKSIPIPAERVDHFFRQNRVRQTRGVTLFSPTMMKMRHLGMYDEYQLIAARLEACIGGVIERDSYAGDLGIGLPKELTDTGEDAYGSDEIVMEPGMMPRLRPGEKVSFNTPTKPGPTYQPFVRAQIGQSAAGIGLDYAQLARDYSEGNFSSQRQALLDVWKETDALQLLLITDFCVPIREAFKRFAIMQGLIEAPGFFDSPEMEQAYLEDEWRGPKKPWIDPLKEVTAAAKAIDYTLETHASLLNERGQDVRDVFRQKAEDKKLADQLEIDFPSTKKELSNVPSEEKKNLPGKE